MGQNFFCQCYGRAAGGIQLVNMMRLLYAHVVIREPVHDACQKVVERKENVYAQTKIRCIEESFTLLVAHLPDFVQMIQPSCGARYYRHAGCKRSFIVLQCALGCSKFNRYLSTLKCRGVELIFLIYVDDTDYFMSSFPGYFSISCPILP